MFSSAPTLRQFFFEVHPGDQNQWQTTQENLLHNINDYFSPEARKNSSSFSQRASSIVSSTSRNKWYSRMFCCFSTEASDPLDEVLTEDYDPSVRGSVVGRQSNISTLTVNQISVVVDIMNDEYSHAKKGEESLYLGGTFGGASQSAYSPNFSFTKVMLFFSDDDRARQVDQIRQWALNINVDTYNHNRHTIYDEFANFIAQNGSFISSNEDKQRHSPVNYLLLALFLSPLRPQLNQLIENNFFQRGEDKSERRVKIARGALELPNTIFGAQSVFFMPGSVIEIKKIFNHGMTYKKGTNADEKSGYCLASGLLVYNKLTIDLIYEGYYVVIIPVNGPYLVTQLEEDSDNGRCSLLYIDGIDSKLQKLHRDSVFCHVPGTKDLQISTFSMQNTQFGSKSTELNQREGNREKALNKVLANALNNVMVSEDNMRFSNA